MSTVAWPRLREDLALLPGPSLPDGQPSWTLHDPARNLFFRIDWPSFEMLSRWGMGDGQQIASDIARSTTLNLEADDVAGLGRFLEQNQLVQPAAGGSAARMAERWSAMRSSWLKWLVHHYLFFRVPLVRPDAWLTRWLPVARRFASAGFLWLTAAALMTGLIQVVRHWDAFTTSLVDTFNLEGLAAYAVALFVVKTLHELGHAFTAKRHGCRVPTMGLAFLVMWPVAYTDTNEAWKLTNARHRLQVAVAGIATELVIAAWATLAWALLPDGALRSAAFVLATTSWVATLAINASPFMRFDGYFILSDALDMPNLHERSFALARWRLREWLFALNEAPPEHFRPAARRAMITFAWLTWIYRLVLFIGIALMVYHLFFKLLGIVLFVVEIVWFILKPVHAEWKAWRERAGAIRASRRTWWTLAILTLLLGLTAVPWPSAVTASALLRPVDVWPVHTPAGAVLDQLPVGHGSRVTQGQPLAVLRSPELLSRIRAAESRVERLRRQAGTAAFGEESRQHWLSTHESLVTAESELEALRTEALQLTPLAPWAGTVMDMDPELATGQWIGKGDRLAFVVKEGSAWMVETWLDEDSVARIQVGAQARFHNDAGTSRMIHLTVESIDRDASRVLTRHELAAQHGGHLLVRHQKDQLVPEQAVYRVQMRVAEGQLDPESLAHSWRGQVSIDARSQAVADRYLRQLMTVLVRETGF
ncbi:HlyD family efflux transporter periplasmic adaptor subunit [Hydrogenophaga bisanensis]|uniref:HlyD family efflux transporter periplasmic adaptor subunit n=1 Tax=Hydrogenophaga bisanensis TaxID=439611 RepID=A0ABW2R4X2_9BURK